MSYRDMQKRLAHLESQREQQEQAAQQAWLDSLSGAEIEARCAEYATHDPVGYAAMEALSDELGAS